jgi:hypothetical protein
MTWLLALGATLVACDIVARLAHGDRAWLWRRGGWWR